MPPFCLANLAQKCALKRHERKFVLLPKRRRGGGGGLRPPPSLLLFQPSVTIFGPPSFSPLPSKEQKAIPQSCLAYEFVGAEKVSKKNKVQRRKIYKLSLEFPAP